MIRLIVAREPHKGIGDEAGLRGSRWFIGISGAQGDDV
jgi:hypothetical protein